MFGKECDDTTADLITALVGGLQDKDPYDGGAAAVDKTPDEKARGNVVITAADEGATQKILLTTCYDKDCSADKTLTTTVQVFE